MLILPRWHHSLRLSTVLQLVIVTIKQQVHSLIALKLLLLHSQSKQMPLQSEAYLWQMLIYFYHSFTVELGHKFAATLLYFPSHLQCVAALPSEIQNIKNSRKSDIFNIITTV